MTLLRTAKLSLSDQVFILIGVKAYQPSRYLAPQKK